MSVMEHSHRGKEYEAVHNEAIALMRELLPVPATFEVLFVQGGASMQFAFIPMNFLPPGGSADFVVTGAWTEKAHAEAAAWANVAGARVRVAASTASGGYHRVARPDEADLDPKAAYVHYATNETIHGVQYTSDVRFGDAPQVADVLERLSLAADRHHAALAGLRGRAEKHRAERRDDRPRPEGLHRARAERPAEDPPVPHARRGEVPPQHPRPSASTSPGTSFSG